jgi:dihydroorotase
MHFLHLSTRVRWTSWSRRALEGLRVTFEVAPHHFTLDEQSCEGFDPAFKVHPPLRTKDDVDALEGALTTWRRRRRRDRSRSARAGAEGPALRRGARGHARTRARSVAHVRGAGWGAVRSRRVLPGAQSWTGRDRATSTGRRTTAPQRPRGVAQRRRGRQPHGVLTRQCAGRCDAREHLHGRSTNTPYDQRSMLGKVRATLAKGRLIVDEGELV